MKRPYRLGFMIYSAASDYSKGLITGVSTYCQQEGLELIVFTGRSFGWPYSWEYQETAIYSHIHNNSVDGLVIASGTQCNFIGEEAFTNWVNQNIDVPVVSISIPLKGIPSVLVDNRIGLRKLFDHLYEVHGCRQFGIVTGPDENVEARERLEVFKSFLDQKDLNPEAQIFFRGDFTAESCYESLGPWLEDNKASFQALICMNDTMAGAALDILDRQGYQVPEDIIVTGFDNIARSRFEIPTLTTVNQSLELQGQTAAALAHDLMRGKKVDSRVTLHTQAVYRQSCGCIGRSELAKKQIAFNEDNECIDLDATAFIEASSAWFKIQDDLSSLRNYLSTLISMISVDGLLDHLAWGLGLFGIKFCTIVLFENPIEAKRSQAFKLPSKAQVALHFEDTVIKNRTNSPLSFDPRQALIPPEILGSQRRYLFATSLYFREHQLGYMVWEVGNCDPAFYEIISTQLAGTIRSALIFEAKQKVEARLNLALKDLERYNIKLSAISRTDELTRLYNRRGFISLGQEAMDLAIRMDKTGLVVFSDMDGLKDINDNWGHDAGDRAIIAMGQILKKTFRSMDIIARLGGDEFAVVATDINKRFIKALRDRMDAILTEYNATSGESFTLSLSLGAVEFSGDENQRLETLLTLADSVLYEEKKLKRSLRTNIKDKL